MVLHQEAGFFLAYFNDDVKDKRMFELFGLDSE